MKEEKKLLIEDVEGILQQHGSFLITSYQGLTANLANSFRRGVKGTGGCVEVLKKRLLVKIAQKHQIDLSHHDLSGHLAMVFCGKDSLETTKHVFQFKKEQGLESFAVVGAHIDGQLLQAKEVEALSKLPGKDEMRAQLLGLFVAPMTQVVSVMDALICSPLHCLQNKVDKQS